MAFQDQRDYIAALEREGEIQRIEKEVDWDLEVGAIIRRSYDLKAPAPYFQNIKGYPAGYRILGAPIGTSSQPKRLHARLAISLGMKPDSTYEEIVEGYIKSKKNPLKPTLVSNGPCKEHVHIGDEIDLDEFPVPLLHEGDGGRYIGTWHLVATRDPDTDWVNWGTYRVMIHDKKSMGILLSPNQHIGLHYAKYESRGQPMQFAIAIGTEPVTPLIAASFYPAGVNEVDFAGSVRGEPVELVKCETVDLAVPATSEIVIEGVIPPFERQEEGPFGEYTGYRAGERAPRPICRVTAITHRRNPVLPVSCLGVPVDDSAALKPLRSAEILDDLRTSGFPVKMVNCPLESPLLFVVSTKVPYAGYPRHLAAAVWGGNSGGRSANYLVIVEDDVDITDSDEVLWALTTRCHPDRGIFKMTGTSASPLLPFLSLEEKRKRTAAHVLFDCTWPKDWPKEAIPVKASFDVLWPKEVQEKVLKSWKEYGYR
ncbi:MAG: UbiD family decarboxylase [Dehalococcoidia bacterium]|nr:UbiD family decarboxylase [Dehalococcoidia bacterium]